MDELHRRLSASVCLCDPRRALLLSARSAPRRALIVSGSALPNESFGYGDAGVQRAFHVTDEGVAGVFACEMEAADTVAQRWADRGNLPRRRKGIAGASPQLVRPVHE